ncbi:MAG: hypothetical protein NE328_21935 [Lentisphaeraceae bacterium]|nr:hypothetical protein [Lentisphaeraceae bacterium]
MQDLEIVIANPGSFPSATSIQSHFNSSGGVQISAAEAQVIFNHVNGGGAKAGQNAHVFVMSLLAFRTKAIIQLFLKELSSPKKPI